MADHIKAYDTVCAVANPYTLKGTCIGHVMTLEGNLLYVVQMKDGFFVGTRTSLSLLKKVEDHYSEQLVERTNDAGGISKTLKLTYHKPVAT